MYGPNNDEIRIFEKLEEYIKENEEKTIIIGGDFNTVLDETLDKRNGRTDTHRKCRSKIRNLMDTYNLIDIWRETHPNIKQYTWHSAHKPPIFSRLDCFLVSEGVRIPFPP